MVDLPPALFLEGARVAAASPLGLLEELYGIVFGASLDLAGDEAMTAFGAFFTHFAEIVAAVTAEARALAARHLAGRLPRIGAQYLGHRDSNDTNEA